MHAPFPSHNISLVKLWGFVLWAGPGRSEEREAYSVVSQLAKPIWLWAVTEGGAPALPCCGSRLLCSQLHQHTVLSSRSICVCSGKGLTQQLSGRDKALCKLRISNINIGHGFVDFWRDANGHRTSHRKRRLFLLILGILVFTGGIDLMSQDSFVCTCVSKIRDFTPQGKM